MILMTDVSSMDPVARAAQNMFRAAILQELGLVPAPETGGNQGHGHAHEHGHDHEHDDDIQADGMHDDEDPT